MTVAPAKVGSSALEAAVIGDNVIEAFHVLPKDGITCLDGDLGRIEDVILDGNHVVLGLRGQGSHEQHYDKKQAPGEALDVKFRALHRSVSRTVSAA